jgi:hypothetical protein
MNELLESELRDFYAAFDDAYDATAALTRIRATEGQSPRRPRRWWAAAAGFSSAVTAGAVTAILLLSSGASVAYAGWTPVPTTATHKQILAAASDCDNTAGTNGSAELFVSHPVLAETRGRYTSMISITHGHVYVCLYGHEPKVSANVYNDVGLTRAAPAADKLSARYRSWGGGGVIPRPFQHGKPPLPKGTSPRHMTQAEMEASRLQAEGAGYGLYALGQAGDAVKAVKFRFADGKSIDATVQNGWYFAWWPWFTDPTSVQVTTRSAIATSPMKPSNHFSPLPQPACKSGSQDCVFDQ